VEEEEQRVVDAEWLPADKQSGLPGAQLRVTLLAAGFVIGASGASVRELSQKTRTSIQSWTEKHSSRLDGQNSPSFRGFAKLTNPTRVFRIRGVPNDVSLAAEIIREAVGRYNELCEGKRRGEFVRRAQKVRDVEFSYQPPPKTAALPNVQNGASARLTPPVAQTTHPAFVTPHPVASVVAAAAMQTPHPHMGYPGCRRRALGGARGRLGRDVQPARGHGSRGGGRRRASRGGGGGGGGGARGGGCLPRTAKTVRSATLRV
jgi:hypothetical protein